jgi:hypothetical protein
MLLPWAPHRLSDALDCSRWFQTCSQLYDRMIAWSRKSKHVEVAMPLLTGACVCISWFFVSMSEAVHFPHSMHLV